MGNQIQFTKAAIERLPLPAGRVEYRDARIPELRLRVSSAGVKSFSVFKRLPGEKPIRITLGRFPGVSVDTARKLALKNLCEISEGLNPNEKKRVECLESITLDVVFGPGRPHISSE